MADGTALPGLVTYGDDATSRLLSAAAHLDEEFAQGTAVELTGGTGRHHPEGCSGSSLPAGLTCAVYNG